MAIKQLYDNEADVYLDKLIWWLAIQHDIDISCSALQSNLEDAGLTCKLLHKIASEWDEEPWVDFHATVREHSAGQGDEFIFLDKMSKNNHDVAHCYGWSMWGERTDFIDNFVRSDRHSLLAAIITNGYVACWAVLGSFDSVELYDFVAEQLVWLLSLVLNSVIHSDKLHFDRYQAWMHTLDITAYLS